MGQIVTNDKFINTGYTFKKYSRYDTAAATIDDKNDINIILMRYADILMIYAEARNERLDKPDQPIYDGINEVRNRPSVKMPLFDKTKDNLQKSRCVKEYVMNAASNLQVKVGITMIYAAGKSQRN